MSRLAKQIIPKKTPMPEQLPAERIKNYDEVIQGYTPEQAMAEANRCLECGRPLCIEGCPVNVNIPAFLKLVAKGDFHGAVNLVKETNSLPAVTGRVCPQEQQCEGKCALSKRFESVAIGRLERFVADWEAAQSSTLTPEIPPSHREEGGYRRIRPRRPYRGRRSCEERPSSDNL